jgi:NADH:ubiquinone oxidoreductase subunit K
MRRKPKVNCTVLKLSAVFLFCLGLTGLQAQEAVTTSGGDASGSGGSASYSVGQMVYTTNTGADGSATQGIQQPFEILTITAIEEAIGIKLSVAAYPNPTTDYLTLSVDNFELSNLMYGLYDMNGKLLETKKIVKNQTIIAMSKLVSASYFIKIATGSKEVKTFKIIKN